jgi:hypothetical protein
VGVYGSLATPDVLAAERIRDALRAARLPAQREGAGRGHRGPRGGDIYALGLHAAATGTSRTTPAAAGPARAPRA